MLLFTTSSLLKIDPWDLGVFGSMSTSPRWLPIFRNIFCSSKSLLSSPDFLSNNYCVSAKLAFWLSAPRLERMFKFLVLYFRGVNNCSLEWVEALELRQLFILCDRVESGLIFLADFESNIVKRLTHLDWFGLVKSTVATLTPCSC